MTENIIKRPLLKAIFFALIPTVFAVIAGIIISIKELDDNFSLVVQTICFTISIIVGIIIIRTLHWQFTEIGICKVQKDTLKKVLFFLPLIIIEILPFFTGLNDKNNSLRIILLIAFTVIVGINEEIYFRGIILSLFRKNIIKSIIVSSVLFGIVHIANSFSNTNYLYIILQVAFAFVIGIVYAETVIITKSIIPAILFHSMHDFVAMVTNDSVEGTALIILIIQFIILIIYAIIMYFLIKREI